MVYLNLYSLVGTYGVYMGNDANVTDIFDIRLIMRPLRCPPPRRDSERDPPGTTAMSIYNNLGQ